MGYNMSFAIIIVHTNKHNIYIDLANFKPGAMSYEY